MSEEKFGPFRLSKEMEEKRLKGLANVEKYLAIEGPDRNVRRMEISTEDSYISLPFGGCPDPRHPFQRIGDTRMKAEHRQSGKQEIFPDWIIYGSKIYTTSNPDLILVECYGRGRQFDPRFEEPDYYCNHYILKIKLVDGLIHEVAEIFNPFECFRDTGINDPPKIL